MSSDLALLIGQLAAMLFPASPGIAVPCGGAEARWKEP